MRSAGPSPGRTASRRPLPQREVKSARAEDEEREGAAAAAVNAAFTLAELS
jgi:hypothetical protein